MNKPYDQKCILCETCAHHRPEGERPTLGRMEWWPEGCGRYAYIFHDYPELAQECEGFQTKEQYEAQQLLKKRQKTKKR